MSGLLISHKFLCRYSRFYRLQFIPCPSELLTLYLLYLVNTIRFSDEICQEKKQASSLYEGLAAVKQNNKWGYINKYGDTLIPFIYDFASSFKEELARIRLNQKCGYINKIGKISIPCIYQEGQSFSEGLVAVKLKGKWGFLNRSGETIVPFEYDHVGSFVNGVAIVEINSIRSRIKKP